MRSRAGIRVRSRAWIRVRNRAGIKVRITSKPLVCPSSLPQGPGDTMIQFCMASLLATLVLDDDVMNMIRECGEAPILFEATITLVSSSMAKLHAELDRQMDPDYYFEV